MPKKEFVTKEEFNNFKKNIDSWIKEIKNERARLSVIDEMANNIQHDYELIHELNQEVNLLKKENHYQRILLNILLKSLKDTKIKVRDIINDEKTKIKPPIHQ